MCSGVSSQELARSTVARASSSARATPTLPQAAAAHSAVWLYLPLTASGGMPSARSRIIVGTSSSLAASIISFGAAAVDTMAAWAATGGTRPKDGRKVRFPLGGGALRFREGTTAGCGLVHGWDERSYSFGSPRSLHVKKLGPPGSPEGAKRS
eukprot:1377723-Prymnesium_polylepis.2